jgi:hypothetical protein
MGMDDEKKAGKGTPERIYIREGSEGVVSKLAMTLQMHIDSGSSARYKILEDNPGKTMGEVMDESALRKYMMDQIAQVEQVHAEAQKGDAMDIKTLQNVLKNFLIPDIEYLRQIGRLPPEADFDPLVRFALGKPEQTP